MELAIIIIFHTRISGHLMSGHLMSVHIAQDIGRIGRNDE